MAIGIQNYTNIAPADSDYPDGNIRDKSQGVAGTPVNTETYADIHQLFAKLLRESGTTPNGLPENETNGYEYFEALQKLFVQKEPAETNIKMKVIEIGDWDMDTDSSVSVNHGISSGSAKIRNIEIHLISDAGLKYLPYKMATSINGISAVGASTDVGISGNNPYTDTVINLTRVTGGFYDSTDFDSTSYNRGWITITYEA